MPATLQNGVYHVGRPLLYTPELYRRSRYAPPAPGLKRLPALIVHGDAVRAFRGFGALDQQQSSIANAAMSGAILTGTLLGGPLGGAIAAAISQLGILLANAFSGCGQTCVEATKIANQVEPILQQNVDKYMSAPVHYASLQAGALNNFDFTWQALQQACSNPQLQAAGQRCISDRQRGACTWKASPGGWAQDTTGKWTYTGYGAAGSGDACWNWFVGYRDPIANDPTVVADPPGSALLSTFGLDPNATFLGVPLADLVLPALLMFGALIFL
jgi:hypothetical protein